MSDKKLIIISVDALNAKDYDYIKKLPTFSYFLDHGAHVPKVASMYPTVTYTCHTSISTGHYPNVHHIYNNEYPQPHKATTQDWRWFEKAIKTPTIFDYARQEGHTTATFLWPVMGDADVDWNLPEVWSPDNSISGLKLLWQHGTKNIVFPAIANSWRLKGKSQPALDNFTESVASRIIKKKKPDLTAIHLTELDTIRHIYGLESKEAYDSLDNIDKRIHRLIQITKENGTYNNTNFVLLGDHGTHDFSKVIEINSFLAQHNMLKTDGTGTITSWLAYGCTCGGSCHIHLSKHISSEHYVVLNNLLNDLAEQPDSPIHSILTKDEALKKYHLSGDFEWVLEAKPGHTFRNTVSGNLITDRTKIPGCYKGDHGYLPEHEDMGTMLLMMGPDIKKATMLEHCSLVDEGPTFAALMGITMEKTDGRILTELIN